MLNNTFPLFLMNITVYCMIGDVNKFNSPLLVITSLELLSPIWNMIILSRKRVTFKNNIKLI